MKIGGGSVGIRTFSITTHNLFLASVCYRPFAATRGIYQTKGDLAPSKLWPNDIFAGTFLYSLRHRKRNGGSAPPLHGYGLRDKKDEGSRC